jgi:hypothetical protein
MIKIQKQQTNSTAGQQNIQAIKQNVSEASKAIRAASASELTKYEKDKLSNVEDKAQQNKIECFRINGNRVPIDSNKTVNIDIGKLAFKSAVTSDDIDSSDLFFIKCELD